MGSASDERVQHRLKIRGRRADDSQDLRRRGLLLPGIRLLTLAFGMFVDGVVRSSLGVGQLAFEAPDPALETVDPRERLGLRRGRRFGPPTALAHVWALPPSKVSIFPSKRSRSMGLMSKSSQPAA